MFKLVTSTVPHVACCMLHGVRCIDAKFRLIHRNATLSLPYFWTRVPVAYDPSDIDLALAFL